MSRYRFVLEDYHAVHRADIDIDGITVLAGPNGCGKKDGGEVAEFLCDDFDGVRDIRR